MSNLQQRVEKLAEAQRKSESLKSELEESTDVGGGVGGSGVTRRLSSRTTARKFASTLQLADEDAEEDDDADVVKSLIKSEKRLSLGGGGGDLDENNNNNNNSSNSNKNSSNVGLIRNRKREASNAGRNGEESSSHDKTAGGESAGFFHIGSSFAQRLVEKNRERLYKQRRYRKLHELKLAFSEFYLSLIILQNYQTLNSTGFKKILKKHDKIFRTERGMDWFKAHVETAPFYSTKKVDTLISEVENLFAEKLEKGNKQRAMERLRVPPFEEKVYVLSFFFTFQLIINDITRAQRFLLFFCSLAKFVDHLSGRLVSRHHSRPSASPRPPT